MFMIIISVVLLVLAFLISFAPIQGFNQEKSIEDELDIKIQTLDNNDVYLSDFLGNEIIIDFFATWCVPCEAQARLLQRFTVIYPNVTIISVSVDINDDIAKLQDYKDRTGIPWLFGRDIDLKANDLYGTYQLPTIAFIDSSGTLKQLKHSVATFSELEDWINDQDISEELSRSTFYLFGLEISSTIGFPLFFFVGLYVALSPCLFPIMPITLLNILRKDDISEADNDQYPDKMIPTESLPNIRRIKALEWVFMLWSGILFSFGIFALIGVFIGATLIQYYIVLNLIFGIVLIIMGYIILIPKLEMNIFTRIPIPQRIQNTLQKESYSSYDLFSLGAVYSIIALPCSGPVFIALLPLVIGFNNTLVSIFSLALFALGLFLPYLALVIVTSEAQTKFVKGIHARYNIIKSITAILIILIGGLLAWPFFGGPLLFAFG